MTIPKFLFFSFLQWLLISLLKIVFFKYVVLSNSGLQSLLYWVLTAVIVVAMCRRLGVINFFESIFIIIFWVAGDALSDLILTSLFLGTSIFSNLDLWIGYLIQALAIFMFHKKRHIQIRKQQAHHGHGHH